MTDPSSCPLCGAMSAPLASVADHYFGSPGIWKYRRCTDAACGVAFPDPAPTDTELANAYSSYYTHEDSGGTRLPGGVEAALTKVATSVTWSDRVPLLGWLAEQIAWEIGGLMPRQGLVVDVGCGDGARLPRLLQAGWSDVAGVEPDPAAVEVARAASLNVRQGSAEAVPLADATADAVLMHHVIEHVRDPVLAIREAWRILKPGGELSIVTPNIESNGRDRWGAFWRGFEAPRHLTIFTSRALGRLATDVGFEIRCNRTSARSTAWVDDVSARAAGTMRSTPGLLGRIRRAEQAFRDQSGREYRDRGEEIVFVARKR